MNENQTRAEWTKMPVNERASTLMADPWQSYDDSIRMAAQDFDALSADDRLSVVETFSLLL